jgi:hypothetical protein
VERLTPFLRQDMHESSLFEDTVLQLLELARAFEGG